jgi:poly(A) polymerase
VEPTIYSFQSHLIPPEKIDSHAFYVIEKLRNAGFVAFLVGGSVRDLLLNVRPKDFDISTSARPEEIKQLFRGNCILIGRRFRLAHVRFGKKVLEVSTFRAGDIESDELVLRDNIWGSEQEDALRRDFTINGLFYDPQTQNIIDYVSGFEDAQKKILRTIGNPRLRFAQDPVRMIRLLKFRARFDFNVDEETQNALYDCRHEIKKSSPARIFEELLRMLESGASKKFFGMLQEFGLLPLLLPKLSSLLEKKTTIYDYLHQVDILTSKHFPHSIDRSILLACVLFPSIEEKILSLVKKEERLHLGIIAQQTSDLLSDFFLPFFQLSRNMKGTLVSLLTHQFRLTPPYPVSYKKIRIPSDPAFDLGLQFFKIRCALHEELMPIYTLWSEHLIRWHKTRQQSRPPRKP